MLICIFEDEAVKSLYPMTRTRASCMLRGGHRTLLETARQNYSGSGVILHCRPSLADAVREKTGLPVNRIPEGVDVLFVNGRLLDAGGTTAGELLEMARGNIPLAFCSGDNLVAAWIPAGRDAPSVAASGTLSMESMPAAARRVELQAALVDRVWQLLDQIASNIESDFAVLTKGYNVFERPGSEVSDHAVLIQGENVFIAPGAQVKAGVVIDASNGPVIVGIGAVVLENVVLRGPISIGAHTQVKAASIVDGAVVGPWCKVAGEIHGSIIHGYSNKAHPGYMGDSMLGSWCNLGADTNTSNLRNDYADVSLYNEMLGQMESSGRIFAGLFMGDHSKCGINTMFNTGTTVGVSCNLFGAGYQPRYVPSFMWGSPPDRFTTYRLPKALDVARIVMARRNTALSPADEALLGRIFAETETARARGPIV